MRPSVLVVEDYTDLRSAIAAALTRHDYVCDSALSVDDALIKLREGEYVAILLAPTCPLQDDRVVKYLTENRPAELHKIILMVDPDESESNDYRVLSKPFNNDELFDRLEH